MKLALEATAKEKVTQSEGEEGMALVLKGGEFIATEALTAGTLSRLMTLAERRPLFLNGRELHHLDLAKLVQEAHRTGKPVWPNQQLDLLIKS